MEETNEKTIFLIVLMLIIVVGVSIIAKTEAKEITDINTRIFIYSKQNMN